MKQEYGYGLSPSFKRAIIRELAGRDWLTLDYEQKKGDYTPCNSGKIRGVTKAMKLYPMKNAPRFEPILAWGTWAGEITGPVNHKSWCVIHGIAKTIDYPGYDWVVANSDAYAEWFKPECWTFLPEPPP